MHAESQGTLIAADRIFTGDDELSPGWVEILSGRISALGTGPAPRLPDHQLVGGFLAPGLVDAQVNGAFGIDLADAGAEGWSSVSRRLLETGVTAFVPTFTTAPWPDLMAALRGASHLVDLLLRPPGLAQALGVHCEGPFLAESRRGAHPAEHLRLPSPDLIDELIQAGGHQLLYVTLAPELPGASAAIRRLTSAGVRVAIGHSEADASAARAAIEAGATLVTHLYNAQSPLLPRAPGIVGVALSDPRLTSGLIVDGHHVHPEALRVAAACAPGRLMFVSDAVAALGMPEGTYHLGGQEIRVGANTPPLRSDGVLAGAVGRLDDALALAIDLGIPMRQAVEAATSVPARALGRADVGVIAVGVPADLVWLSPQDGHLLRSRAVWRAGALVAGSTAAGQEGAGAA